MGLILRAREGDRRARELLVARFQAPLKRFAHGRLPKGARGPIDTDDLVQETLVRALNHVDGFVADRPGAYLAYMRRILMNQVRDHARGLKRRPGMGELHENLGADGPSPLDQVIGKEALERYESALKRLNPEQEEAVVMRLEWGCSYGEIAEAIGSPTENAARMVVSRAVAKLAELMHELRVETR
jgi:RNA polymerase sigma factor (sigma-70 family)